MLLYVPRGDKQKTLLMFAGLNHVYIGRWPAGAKKFEPWAGTSFKRVNDGPWLPAPPREDV